MRTKRAFTLIELLVVIAIIAILAAILLPMLRTGDPSRLTGCMNNLKQINMGLQMYSDESQDKAPKTPGTTNSPGLNWSGYKSVIKDYVKGDKVFACPLDKFYYNVADSFQYVKKGLHEEPPDFLSYGFNGGNAQTNSNAPGIAGRLLTLIKEPTKTVLVADSPAFIPYSWHKSKPAVPNGAPMFNDAMNAVSFVDGHSAFIKIHWNSNSPPGTLALHNDPPAGYDYKWSGD